MPRFALAALALCAGGVHAEVPHKLTVATGYTNFTDGLGDRSVLAFESATVFGANTLALDGAFGSRNFGAGPSYDGASIGATLWHDWSDVVSTRSNVSKSSDDPVFVNTILDQDVTYHGIRNTSLTVGAKYSDYFDDRHSMAWYAAGAYYFKRLTVRYRYTHYDLSDVGGSHANLLSFRFKDAEGAGYTQLWLGEGTGIHDYEWAPIALAGDFESIALRRIQPLGRNWLGEVGFDKSWHRTPAYDYQAMTVSAGLTRTW